MIRNNDQDPSLGLKIIPVIRGLFGEILQQNLTSLDFLCSLVSPPPPKKIHNEHAFTLINQKKSRRDQVITYMEPHQT